MTEFGKLAGDLAQMRDEIRLKIHLGSRDLQDEWAELETRWNRFSERAQLGRSGAELGVAMEHLGKELKTAYERFRRAL